MMKDPAFRQKAALITVGVVLFVGLMHLDTVGNFLRAAASLVFPFVAGLCTAFVLNVPMHAFEQMLTRWYQRQKNPVRAETVQTQSFFLTILSLILVVVLIFTIALPQLVRSIRSVYQLLEDQAPVWVAWLQKHNINTDYMIRWLENLDYKTLLERLTAGAGVLINSVAGMATSAVSGVISFATALVVAVYVLLGKKNLSRQSRKMLYACFPQETADGICHIGVMLQRTFAKFLSGQCIEAIILGLLIFVVFSLFRLPYAALIGMFTGVFAFIPYVGALAACVLGAVLTLIADPGKVLLCIVVYQIVQFIENQFIYPKVVGGSVGLPPLWTLMAAFIGGKLLGLFGMIFFIPLVAVVYEWMHEFVHRRLAQKKIRLE